ncbi:MAG: DUF1295 domain-containing protein [Gemmatimonadales bacterium]|nr:DUF1295 domain-containing protein [Gemmatimonadales bacterium]MYG47939.1 DUF1295 domain-containing protein [Gemmatimonadales bacterium]MYK02036.1 DUF1295 domain-containing protein [Candidatus Palauibacter ramosifaciens]
MTATEGTGLHSALVWTLFALAPLTFVGLLRLKVPYGRHYSGRGWGPGLPDRVGWILMEAPAPAFFAVVYFAGPASGHTVPLVFLGIWQCHYLNRTFIYPLRTRTRGKSMPAVVAASGFAFNMVNAYVNARWISELGQYGAQWLGDPRFLAGVFVFAAGFALNLHSDNTLLKLRKPGETGYSIPCGGGFRYVSCPNYLGEAMEWAGWALATWSLAGLAFFLFTAANLVPRALSHHRWYRERFEDYPPGRKAIIPGWI